MIVARSAGNRLYAANLAAEVPHSRERRLATKACWPFNSILDTAKFLSEFGFAIPDMESSVNLVVRRLISR